MEPIIIDPRQGWHSAAGMSAGTLRFLIDLALSELAIRNTDEDYERILTEAFEQNQESQRDFDKLRNERDLMTFAAEVLQDIRSLPVALD